MACSVGCLRAPPQPVRLHGCSSACHSRHPKVVATHCPAGSLWTLAALTQLRRLTIDVHEPYMNTISQHLQPLTTLTSLDLSRLGSGPLRDNVQVGAGCVISCTGGIDGSCRPSARHGWWPGWQQAVAPMLGMGCLQHNFAAAHV